MPVLPPAVSSPFPAATEPSQPARTAQKSWRVWGPARWVGLAYVGIVGGGIAFVLFFDGLADTTATPAAFWRDTLVVWVAVLALPFLRERVTWWNALAIAVLVVGQVAIAGGVGHLAADRGELLVLGATFLWAVEVVVARSLLRDMAPAAIALVRMGIGALALIIYLFATGTLHRLASLDATQVGWALLTGLLLAAYVGTWMTALARARAVDVTSVLVGSALVTALLQAAAGTTSLAPQALGLLLVLAGASIVLWASLGRPSMRRRARPVDETEPAYRRGFRSERRGGKASLDRRPRDVACQAPYCSHVTRIPPNALGYCGPGDSVALLGMVSEGVDLAGLSQRAAQFEGAWPYLQLIAGCNRISDPLDPRVVEAYWTGNELLTRVPASALLSSLGERFDRRAGSSSGLFVVGGAGRNPPTQFSRLCGLSVARPSPRRYGRPPARGPRPLPNPMGARPRRQRRRGDGPQPTPLLRGLTTDSRRGADRASPPGDRWSGLHRRPPSRRRHLSPLGLGLRPTVTRHTYLAQILHCAEPCRRQLSRPTGSRDGVRRMTRPCSRQA